METNIKSSRGEGEALELLLVFLVVVELYACMRKHWSGSISYVIFTQKRLKNKSALAKQFRIKGFF
jgi:hypothetical protein